jgi:hypothetical protein
MLVIDNEGQAFRIKHAIQLNGYGPLWGYSLFFTRRVRLEFAIDSEETLDVRAVKDVICKAMRRDRHIWESDISEDGVAGWQRKVEQAASIQAIIDLIPT